MIEFIEANLLSFALFCFGCWGVPYALFAKRFSFQGDFPLAPEERRTYEATPKLRWYAFVITVVPLIYGAVTLALRWRTRN